MLLLKTLCYPNLRFHHALPKCGAFRLSKDAIYADSHSPMHISTALMMVACAAFMLLGCLWVMRPAANSLTVHLE